MPRTTSEQRCGGALPGDPEALAAYLAERAECGICFGTLDGACSAIARATRPRTRRKGRERAASWFPEGHLILNSAVSAVLSWVVIVAA